MKQMIAAGALLIGGCILAAAIMLAELKYGSVPTAYRVVCGLFLFGGLLGGYLALRPAGGKRGHQPESPQDPPQ